MKVSEKNYILFRAHIIPFSLLADNFENTFEMSQYL